MTEPTLTINRQLAPEAAEHLRRHVHENEPSHEKVYLRIIEQYLSLTDQTPLTVEHCREAGWIRKSYAGEDATEKWKPATVDFFPVYGTLTIENPTLGQLRLALLQENRDGE